MSEKKDPKLEVETSVLESGETKTRLKAKKTDWIEKLVYLDGKPFSFEGRDYLLPIYNSNHPKKLLICGRQVEKCGAIWSTIHLKNGEEKRLDQVAPGDLIEAMSSQGRRTSDRVVASASNGKKRCLRIKTRLGSTLEVTLNHPLRKLTHWAQARDLVVGDRVAALRTVGSFGRIREPLAPLIGLLFGDGCFSSDGSIHQRKVSFTSKNPTIQDWFVAACTDTGHKKPWSFISKTSGSTQYTIGVKTPIGQWLDKHDLYGLKSNTKVLPEECFRYDHESTRGLLRGLWATDGHCKNIHRSKVDLVYCTTSEKLSRQVRLLLRKFGVVTTLRTYQPKRGELAYIIRVTTRKAIEAFHREIGPIPGKPFDIPEVDSNSNLDTLPKDIYPMIARAKEEAGYTGKRGVGSFDKMAGFRFKPCYAPTFEKVAAANEILKDSDIRTVLDSDIIWDQVVSIEDMGVHPTWSIQTETETYVSDFVVQHNSSMIANEIIINSVIKPFYKTLYVSPSHLQTRQFSNGKLKPWIEDSPLLKKYFTSTATSSQVFERGFTNGSMCFLRSAFLTADRARGLSSDLLCVSGNLVVLLEDYTPIRIKDLVSRMPVGARIWTLNEKTGRPEADEIVAAHIKKPKALLRITTESGTFIEVTPDHRVLTWNGWKEAQDLTVEDYVVELGQLAKAEVIYQKVTGIESLGEQVVYDFTMSKNHNFFANNVCVHNCLDELQDLLTSNIPVIEECLSHSPDPKEVMSGTPKTLENPIEQAWQISSMCEWLVPCHRHAPVHWNYLDSKCIGKSGLICNKCGGAIHAPEGKWVAFNASRDVMGYRISQLMVPWFGNEKKWGELIWKYENYGKAQFHNEVLGLSYDSASKPITRTELLGCCSPHWPFRARPDQFTRRVEVFAGIDWGEGTDGTERGAKGKVKNASYTILTLGTYIDPKHFHIFYFKKFTGKEALPGNCVAEILRTLSEFNVRMVGVDWGHGWGVNERIEEALGTRRVVKFQHVGSQKDRMKYDDVGHKYQLARNEVMTEFFLALKDAKIVFPPWEQVKDFLCDYEHIYAEYSEASRSMRYDHKSSEPDDSFHSSLYCLEVANLYYGRKL